MKNDLQSELKKYKMLYEHYMDNKMRDTKHWNNCKICSHYLEAYNQTVKGFNILIN